MKITSSSGSEAIGRILITSILIGMQYMNTQASANSMPKKVPTQPASQTAGVNELNQLDITCFGSIRYWPDDADPLGQPIAIGRLASVFESMRAGWNLGAFWWEERDIRAAEVRFEQPVDEAFAQGIMLQYWHRIWPESPPEMPAKEDRSDDAWRGEWITAQTAFRIQQNSIRLTFNALTPLENKDAAFLPGEITYRRTLKIRLLFPQKPGAIRSFRVLSTSFEKEVAVRIELGCGLTTGAGQVEGSLEVFNGFIDTLSVWSGKKADKILPPNRWQLKLDGRPKGVIAHLRAAAPSLSGSNDETIVTVRSTTGTFSFSVDDLENGPINIPTRHAYVAKASDPRTFAQRAISQGLTIRERLRQAPEQTYERAAKEIPPLDPTQRDPRHALRTVYLPLAADASWQKFAIIWGGNVLIDKRRARARGRELARCTWQGDELRWEIGAGSTPCFQRTPENCQMSLLDNILPLVQARWQHEGLIYEEEAFVTLPNSPLSAFDSTRDEQTPAMLMLQITISNPGQKPVDAHLWLKSNQAISALRIDKEFLMESLSQNQVIRARISQPEGAARQMCAQPDQKRERPSLHQIIPLPANSSRRVRMVFPFVGDLTAPDQAMLTALDYEAEKNRVLAYWRDLVQQGCIFNAPEPKFNEVAKTVIWHIRMSAIKCPESGLFLLPAATLGYWVYANESCFQTILLDRLGDHEAATQYLETFLRLQGSRPLPGAFTGTQQDVFYGVKIDAEYDLTATGYNLHHGTVLWALAQHFLFTRDTDWLNHAAPNLMRAANWILGQRRQTQTLDEDGAKEIHYGLLPAGHLEDADDWQYWYAVNAYAWLGLKTLADAFSLAGRPEAALYQNEAAAYRADLRRSIERASELCPVVRLRNNTYVPYVPVQPHQRFRYFGPKKTQYYDRYEKGVYPTLRLSATREALYGPMILLKTGVIDADEPLAECILDDWEDNLTLSTSLNLNAHGWVDDAFWFSRGGMVFQANLQNPIEAYLKRREIPAALRNLYNDFVSCLYPDVNMLVEEYRCWKHGSGHFYKIPDEARFVNRVCDLLVLEVGEELWLAPGTPRRWLEPGQKIEIHQAHTFFGVVSFTLQYGDQPETIEAHVSLPTRPCQTIRLFVRAPFDKPIKAVSVNGAAWNQWDAAEQMVIVPQRERTVHIQIKY